MPTQRLNCNRSFENVRFLAGARDFSCLPNVWAGSEVYTASYSVTTGALSPEENSWGMKLTYDLYLAPRLRMVSHTPTPPYIFIAWCLLITCRDNFIVPLEGYGVHP